MSARSVIVLVGLPGAGKSTVGAMVAQRLGWSFVDLDAEIEREAGASVRDLFATRGEGEFRRLEREVTQRFAATRRLVFAPGGGWVLDRENPAVFADRALSVYLRVSPEVAVERMRADLTARPLLAGADPARALQGLLEAREALYLQANHVLAVDAMSPTQVADTIVALAMDHIAD